MTVAVIKGYDGMTRTRIRRKWSKSSGETAIETWMGPRERALDMYNSALNDTQYDDVSMDPDAAVGTVELTINDDSQGGGGPVTSELNTIWEVDSNELSKNLKAHPYFQTTDSDAFRNEVADVDKALAENTPFTASDFVHKEQMSRLYAMRQAGIEEYLDGSLVLRKTILVGSRSVLDASYVNINRVIDLNTENPPSAIIGNLNSITKITGYADVAAPQTPTTSLTKWEWLKRPPQVRQLSSGTRFEIIQEFWGADQWATVSYGGTWDPGDPA